MAVNRKLLEDIKCRLWKLENEVLPVEEKPSLDREETLAAS